MEELGLGRGKIEMSFPEQGVRAPLVEKGAAAGALHRHGVGIGSGCFRCLVKLPGVDACRLAVAQDPVAIRILADQAGGCQREGGFHGRQILQHIIGTTAVGRGFAQDIAQHVLQRVGVDGLDVIDDEVATGEDAIASHCWS